MLRLFLAAYLLEHPPFNHSTSLICPICLKTFSTPFDLFQGVPERGLPLPRVRPVPDQHRRLRGRHVAGPRFQASPGKGFTARKPQ